MHMPAGHTFPDATGVAFALGLGPPSLLAAISFVLFFDYPGIFGGLTWSNTLENLHTHWNLRPLGHHRGWDLGVAQRLYGAPWKTIRKLDV